MLHTVDVRKFFSVDSYVIFKYILFDKWAISYAFYSILFLLQYILYTLHSSQFPVTHPLDLCLAAGLYPFRVVIDKGDSPWFFSFPLPWRRGLSDCCRHFNIRTRCCGSYWRSRLLLLTSHCPTPTMAVVAAGWLRLLLTLSRCLHATLRCRPVGDQAGELTREG